MTSILPIIFAAFELSYITKDKELIHPLLYLTITLLYALYTILLMVNFPGFLTYSLGVLAIATSLFILFTKDKKAIQKAERVDSFVSVLILFMIAVVL